MIELKLVSENYYELTSKETGALVAQAAAFTYYDTSQYALKHFSSVDVYYNEDKIQHIADVTGRELYDTARVVTDNKQTDIVSASKEMAEILGIRTSQCADFLKTLAFADLFSYSITIS